MQREQALRDLLAAAVNAATRGRCGSPASLVAGTGGGTAAPAGAKLALPNGTEITAEHIRRMQSIQAFLPAAFVSDIMGSVGSPVSSRR
jgi:hypothetical protein